MNNITSQRNREKFSENGFLYVFDKLSADEKTEFWRCEQKRDCKARLHLVKREVVKTLNSHNHEPSAAKVAADQVITKIKKTGCRDPRIDVPRALPNQPALKKLIRRKRNEINQAPANPITLSALEIPECYRVYISEPGNSENFLLADSGPGAERILIFGRQRNLEENFLLADSGPGAERILIFGRQRNLEMVLTCDDFFMDGTFKIAANIFKQIYVVLAKKFGGAKPRSKVHYL
ncbi:FLYWCH zinc finger domain [Popillia japonica]|uniref:FLYWCH zinc finger domain n=1 Tax=Popillia japonica TaxID=7064 RepID=A0AAW1N1F7_POPJA